MGVMEFLRRPLFKVQVEVGGGRPVEHPDMRGEPYSSEEIVAPHSLDEYAGQDEAKALLRIEVEAAKRTGRPLNHLMVYGPPGVGKTSLAHVLANETGSLLYPSSGAEFISQREILQAFARIGSWHRQTGKPVVWLTDELDAIPRIASYVLHSLLSFGYVTYEGARFGLVPITIIGTTNFVSYVPPALRSRLLPIKLDFYSVGELAAIAMLAARKIGITLSAEAAAFIGSNSGGEPRKITRRIIPCLLNLLGGQSFGDVEIVKRAVALSGLRAAGLTKSQVEYLEFLSGAKDQTAGLSSLAAFLNEPRRDIESEVEPFLLRCRFVAITSKGRTLTDAGKDYLSGRTA